MDRTTVSLIAAILLTILCWAMAVTAIIPSEQPASFRAPDRVESYVVGSFDKLQVNKTYMLAPGEPPSCISREDFQEYGCTFHLKELIKEHTAEADIYTAIFLETESHTMK